MKKYMNLPLLPPSLPLTDLLYSQPVPQPYLDCLIEQSGKDKINEENWLGMKPESTNTILSKWLHWMKNIKLRTYWNHLNYTSVVKAQMTLKCVNGQQWKEKLPWEWSSWTHFLARSNEAYKICLTHLEVYTYMIHHNHKISIPTITHHPHRSFISLVHICNVELNKTSRCKKNKKKTHTIT